MNCRTLPLIVACFVALALSAIADDWPQWRGPNRDGVSKETGLLKSWPDGGPKLLWTAEDCGLGYSSVAVVGDRLYGLGAGDQQEFLFALDVKTGKQVWKTPYGPEVRLDRGNGPRGAPTVDGDRVYAIGSQGELFCAELAAGKIVWHTNLQTDLGGRRPNWGYSESPLIDGDKVVCTPGGAKGTLAALDKTTGKVIWRSTDLAFGAHYSSIVAAELAGIKQYVQLSRDGVFAVSPKDGKKLWHVKLGGAGTATVPTPIVHDGHVFVTSGYGDSKCGLIKITAENGGCKTETVWEGRQLINKHGGVVLLDGVLYGNQDSGRPAWLAIDFKTGNRLGWDSSKLSKGSITFADGRLYLYSEDKGTCVLLEPNPKGWTEAGRFTIPRTRKPGFIWAHPVVANGKLYLRDQNLLFCYDVKDSRAAER